MRDAHPLRPNADIACVSWHNRPPGSRLRQLIHTFLCGLKEGLNAAPTTKIGTRSRGTHPVRGDGSFLSPGRRGARGRRLIGAKYYGLWRTTEHHA